MFNVKAISKITEFLYFYNEKDYKFKHLKEVIKNIDLTNKINLFIDHNFNLLQKHNSSDLRKLKISIMKDFLKLSKSLSKEFKVHKMLIAIYFSLDTKLYPLLLGGKVKDIRDVLTFGSLDYCTHVDGQTIGQVFENDMHGSVQVIKDNIDLFPRSTQEFINIKIAESLPKHYFEKISNQFQYNALLKCLQSETDVCEFEKHAKAFTESTSNYSEKAISLHYLYNAFCSISHMILNQNSVKPLKTDILSRFSAYFTYISEECAKHNGDNSLMSIYNSVRNSKEFINDFIIYSENIDIDTEARYFLLSLIEDEEQFSKIEHSIFVNIEYKFETSVLDISMSSEEFKKALSKEHYRQFRIKHNNFPPIGKFEEDLFI